jgi:hypothetical protein
MTGVEELTQALAVDVASQVPAAFHSISSAHFFEPKAALGSGRRHREHSIARYLQLWVSIYP